MKKVYHESHFTNQFAKLEIKVSLTNISYKLHNDNMLIGSETFNSAGIEDYIVINKLTNSILEILIANNITGFDMVDIANDIANDIFYSKVLSNDQGI